MTADIDAVLSRLAGRPEIAEYVALVAAEVERLRERPECRDAVEAIERLTAERDRWRLTG